ncbi:MAG TPA: hypothetical protein VE710_16455 [Candidatus Bathyarchaeia archaeon]|nr:hypothetical protein [Candidatus Bathyarchaeia archaeon]
MPHPQGSGDCPAPLPKTVRRAKGFKEAFTTDGVARQACTVFGSSTSAGVTMTPPVPLFPSLRGWYINQTDEKKKLESSLLRSGQSSLTAWRGVA